MIMDTNLKNAISAMRKDIAELEKKQKNIKPQRKTVYYKGERTMDPETATVEALKNKEKLRFHYAAYGLLRGKNFDVTEKNAEYKVVNDQKYHPLCDWLYKIDKILNKYGYQLKNYEGKENYWHQIYKKYDLENYEEIVRIGE